MRLRSTRWAMGLGFAGLIALLAPMRAEADVVKAGYDLFQTITPGTNFQGVDFMGVPLGTFNFGGAIGTKTVGPTDTIIQRLSDVTAPAGGSGTTALIMQALQLETTAPTTAFGPLDNYFITLQSTHGGSASTGTMTINFTNPTPGPPPPTQPFAGTFSSSLDVFFDIHKGSLTGAIVASSDLVITNTGTPWSHYPDPNAILITGVNHLLNGVDGSNDFFPIGTFIEKHPTAGQHAVNSAGTAVPEPSVLLTSSLSLAFGAVLAWRSSRKRPA